MKRKLTCLECDGVFTINHSMEDDDYNAEFCVFCGTSIVEELDYDEDESRDYIDLDPDDDEDF